MNWRGSDKRVGHIEILHAVEVSSRIRQCLDDILTLRYFDVARKGQSALDQSLKQSSEKAERGHSIKIVAQRTGVSSHVIRVWERRYSAVTPRRTDTNRRLYSDDEIERLKLLAEATQVGHAISNIATLNDEDLRALVLEDRPTARPVVGNIIRCEEAGPHLERAIAAVVSLDSEGLQTVLEQATVDLTQLVTLEDVVVPLMHRIGDMWHSGELRVVHEHTAHSVVSAFVSSLKTAYSPSADASTVVVATPSGQLHDLGALIVAATAASDGWRIAYLGCSLPVEEIVRAVEHHAAPAIALSIVYPSNDPSLENELRRLRRLLPQSVGIIAGGRAAEGYADVLSELDIHLVTNLRTLRNALSQHRP